MTSAGSSAFKFVVVSPRGERFIWEEGDDRALDARTSVAITGAFGGDIAVVEATGVSAVDPKAEAAAEAPTSQAPAVAGSYGSRLGSAALTSLSIRVSSIRDDPLPAPTAAALFFLDRRVSRVRAAPR